MHHDPRPYRQVLDDLWTAHLSPRAVDAPTVVSTFAGAGGSSFGYSAAGFRELLAVEWDDHAVECFCRNFPDVLVHHGDINLLEVDEVLAMINMKPGELDVFDGSPPCQGFSMAGKRQLEDPKNQLFRQFCRLIEGLQPKAFVMENVKGMTTGNMVGIYSEALVEFQRIGYKTASAVIDFSRLNVPQKRERLVVIGIRKDLATEPSHPNPITPVRTVREAFRDLQRSNRKERDLGLDAKSRAALTLTPQGQSSAQLLMSKDLRGEFFVYIILHFQSIFKTDIF